MSHSCILTWTFFSWLLKLCAEEAAASCTSSPVVLIPGNPLFTSGIIAKEKVLKVGRNVDFEQAFNILKRAGRQPDKTYSRGQFKVRTSYYHINQFSFVLFGQIG